MKGEKMRYGLFGLVVVAVVCAAVCGVASAQDEDFYQRLRGEFSAPFAEAIAKIEKYYVEEVDPKDLIYGALRGMMESLPLEGQPDEHSSFLDPEEYARIQEDTQGHYAGLGIVIGMEDDRLTVMQIMKVGPAYGAGIKAGDKIVQIDGESTEGISLTEAVNKLRGQEGTTVRLVLERNGETLPEITLTRERIELESVRHVTMLTDKVGYLWLEEFRAGSAAEVKRALESLRQQGMQALVFDLRNNTGGVLDEAVAVCDLFLPRGLLIVYTKERGGKIGLERRSHTRDTEPPYPIVILINRGTASGSEIVAGALRAHGRAVLLGTRTFGKGTVQNILPLSDGSALRLTVAKYYTPDDVSIHRKGIAPDIEVPIDPELEARIYNRQKELVGLIVEEELVEETPESQEPDWPVYGGDDVQLNEATRILTANLLLQAAAGTASQAASGE